MFFVNFIKKGKVFLHAFLMLQILLYFSWILRKNNEKNLNAFKRKTKNFKKLLSVLLLKVGNACCFSTGTK